MQEPDWLHWIERVNVMKLHDLTSWSQVRLAQQAGKQMYHMHPIRMDVDISTPTLHSRGSLCTRKDVAGEQEAIVHLEHATLGQHR